jgi:uncharacterized protein YfbU (UPF0304 family)
VADMNLTKVERTMLLNQYRILELICPENAETYIKCQNILERGYKIFYDEVVNVWDELDCQYVLDVAEVFRLMMSSYESLTDKRGIEIEALKFKGFDGEKDWQFGCFAAYLKKIGRWADPPSDYLNTRNPLSHRYHSMVEAFKAIKAKHEDGWNFKLTKEEIQQILKAGELLG